MPPKTTPIKYNLDVIPCMMVKGNRVSKKRIPAPVVLIDTLAEYLKWADKRNRRPTKQGFSVAMGFSTPKALLSWCKRNSGKINSYDESLHCAYTILEDILVNVLTDPSNKNGNGMFRYMQNAYGYRDKIDSIQDQTSRVIRLPARAKPGTAIDRTKTKKKLSRNKSKTTTDGIGKK